MVDNKDKEFQNEIKKIVREYLKKEQKSLFLQEVPNEKMMNDIVGNLDRPEYLADKYGITEQQIQFCYQTIGDELANNPNVLARVAEMVAMVRSYLAEGVGRKITNEEIKPVTEAIGKLTISLLIEKNMWWAKKDYEKQEEK